MFNVPDACDLVVIGGGVAGASAAHAAALMGATVVVLSAAPVMEAHSTQGVGMNGLASREFDWREHAHETLKGSDNFADPDVVSIMCREARSAILELVALGAPFDFDKIGHYGRFSYHTPSLTGETILEALYRSLSSMPNCTVIEGAQLSGLLKTTRTSEVIGASFTILGVSVTVQSRATILATGGCAALFQPSTNKSTCRGEGLALAYLAGAELADLEMTQFHPTALSDGTLVSESARGAGAVLRSDDGTAFMESYAPTFKELAPRDIVARAVHMESAGGRKVHLDFTEIDEPYWNQWNIAQIREVCKRAEGIDIRYNPVPVRPAMHYHIGGILTDVDGRTSVDGLYAAGEVACTGGHGANRLGGNSLLEARVFGRRAGFTATVDALSSKAALSVDSKTILVELPESSRPYSGGYLMTRNCGIVRSAGYLSSLLSSLQFEGGGQGLIARLITLAALSREESRGVHYREDFPTRNDAKWRKRQVVSLTDAGVESWRVEPIRNASDIPFERQY